ncbi:Bax inhibitor-1/YccA family protein [Prauserella rugosa]|uniref:Putative YccA/Bax inhibitor family protein n=1 Tax=Prauserella rugosa TaxID=43354 RepID=A0A660CI21_9PSEU|nr:Bax inhibitor-1/YccA family protein [Prauserella rugosa]KID32068.1 putative membrane protein [Prauserella sp. Am3]KMS84610.1 membrane protein [Streptomyces regensis]TWH20691.1 putative YccA/Bax inhibitor family protein [Prauserella rugosa]
MRTSSNPAFRNLPQGAAAQAPYAGFEQPQGGVPGYGTPQAPSGAADRPMTVDDVVMKTGASLGVTLLVGIITAIWAQSQIAADSMGAVTGAMIGGMLVGLVLSLVIIFKQMTSAPMTLAYSAAEGVFLGAITGVFEMIYPGIAMQAVLGTAAVFVVMLVVYKTGAVKVTPKFQKWMIGAIGGVAILMLLNLVMSLFGVNIGLRDGSTLAIIFSIVCIGIAAFSFLLDFDMADQAIRQGVPAKFAWYVAFGLMTTLVWLYLEILRLLSYLQSE